MHKPQTIKKGKCFLKTDYLNWYFPSKTDQEKKRENANDNFQEKEWEHYYKSCRHYYKNYIIKIL